MADAAKTGAGDLNRIASAARQHDPSLEHEAALELAAQAQVLLGQGEAADAPALARALLRSHPHLDVSHLNAVAKATTDALAGTD